MAGTIFSAEIQVDMTTFSFTTLLRLAEASASNDTWSWASGSRYGLVITEDPASSPLSTTGTIEQWLILHETDFIDDVLLDFAGFTVAAADILAAAATATDTDDHALMVNALSGDDRIYGSHYGDILVGYVGNDVVYGDLGNDWCQGGAGDDTLFGDGWKATGERPYGEVKEQGHDRLTGGAGNDWFVFDTRATVANSDVITDFHHGHDHIGLSIDFFSNFLAGGDGTRALSRAAFWKSASGLAHDANDRIIYETDTGWLNYDWNGSATIHDNNGHVYGPAIHIAKLVGHPLITHDDIWNLWIEGPTY